MSKDEADRNSSKVALAVVLVVIAALAAIILVTKALRKDYTYNAFPFEKSGILWVTYAEKNGQPYRIPFYYHPSELEDIVAERGAEQVLLRAAQRGNVTVYITLDPSLKSKAVVAAVEISRLTGDRYNILNLETHGALTRKPEQSLAETPRPIVTCANADNDTIVIWLTLSQANFIHTEGNCVILEALSEDDLLRVADRFAYMIIGVMD